MKWIFALIAIVVALTSAVQVQAVPPPDFIFNVGSILIQFFTLAFLLLSAAFGSAYQFLKARLATRRAKIVFLIASLGLITVVAGGGAYLVNFYYQKQAYGQWLAESKKMTEQAVEQELTATSTSPLDTLQISQTQEATSTGIAKFEIKITQPLDKVGVFIRDYYSNIANGNFEQAYNVSKRTVSLATFKSWYASTTRIVIEKLQRIDETKASLELTLFEGQSATQYGVLMTVGMESGQPARVEKSEVRALSQGSTDERAEGLFFDTHKDLPAATSNTLFRDVIQSGRKDFIVLDARENVEYENGYFPGSLHIRYADLQAGRWIELPRDKYVYVFCWSGIRGSEVANFLRTKQILATSLDGGAKGWVDVGGIWDGNIMFKTKYSDERYQKLFTTDEVKQKIKDSVIMVDSREPYKFKQWHIPGSVNIPLMYTPTIKIEEVMAQVPKDATVITVCDAYVNCFDANITGVELEKRGHAYLGRYSQPWEMK